MSRRSQRRSSSSSVRLVLLVLMLGLFLVICACGGIYAVLSRLADGDGVATPDPGAALIVAYSPEK